MVEALWWAGSLGQLMVTVWVLSRWWRSPGGLPHWGMSFPMAAFSALTLRLVPNGPLAAVGVALLAMTSLMVAAFLLATWRGLRDGRLLAPETVAVIVPTSSA